MSKRLSEVSTIRENLYDKLNKDNFSKIEKIQEDENKKEIEIQKNISQENSINEKLSSSEQPSEYKIIYDSIKKTKHYLNLIEIFRIMFIIIFSLVIYFDLLFTGSFSENKKTIIISTFILLESSFNLMIYFINSSKVMKNSFN